MAAVKEVLREVASVEVTALSIASFGEAIVMLNARGEVLARSIYYSDIRGKDEVADIHAAIDPVLCQAITGTPANPMFSANKLLWIKKHEPEVLQEAKYTMLFGDYIAYVLTGERVIDFSLASRTMLFDIRNNRWSDEVMNALGLPAGGFSSPVRMGTQIGKLLPNIANELGFSNSVIVVAGGHDQALAALGSGATRSGDSVNGMGSSECIAVVLGSNDISDTMSDYNFCAEPYLFDDTYLTLAFNASAGTAIRWFRDCFSSNHSAAESEENERFYQTMERECPAEPTQILFLPFVAGSGTPYLDSEIGGAFVGLSVSSTKQEMFKAVLQGICLEIQYNAQLLNECGIALKTVTAVGGAVKSDLLMQTKADIMNRDISILATPEAGTVGLALLCAYATGDIDDIVTAARNAAKKTKTYQPNPKYVPIYASMMERYCRIYPAMRSIYR